MRLRLCPDRSRRTAFTQQIESKDRTNSFFRRKHCIELSISVGWRKELEAPEEASWLFLSVFLILCSRNSKKNRKLFSILKK
jgi:hypothetical protein